MPFRQWKSFEMLSKAEIAKQLSLLRSKKITVLKIIRLKHME